MAVERTDTDLTGTVAQLDKALTDRISTLDRRLFRQTSLTPIFHAACQVQSIPTTTFTTVSSLVVQYDSHQMWSSANPSQYTIPAGWAGVYLVWGYAQINTAFPLDITIAGRIARNGTAIDLSENEVMARGPSSARAGPIPIKCAVGDFLQFQVYHDDGSTRQINGAHSTFVVTWGQSGFFDDTSHGLL